MTNALLTGALAGAGAMYFLDPERGRRRRALVRDQVEHLRRQFEDELDSGSRDAANRARGVVAAIGRMFGADDAPDRIVEARVRSVLGRVATYPRAIDVTVEDGCVRLEGPILAHEADPVRAAVAALRGVTSIDDALELHDSTDGVPNFKGAGKRAAGATRVPPAARVALGALAATSVFRFGLSGRLLRAAAMAALGAAVANAEKSRVRSEQGMRERGNGHATS